MKYGKRNKTRKKNNEQAAIEREKAERKRIKKAFISQYL